MSNNNPQRVYLKFIFLTWLSIILLASIQFNFVYEKFSAKLLIVPSIVGILVGVILARQALLKRRIERTQHKFSSIVEMAEEMSYLQSPDGSYQFVSQSAFDLTGYTPEDFYEMPNFFSSLLDEEQKQLFNEHHLSALNKQHPDPIELKLKDKMNRTLWIRHSARPVIEKNKVVAVSSTNIDITEQVEQEKNLLELAIKDPLTDLPNRRKFYEELNQKLVKQSPFNLVMMDLDRFKNINDTLGHSVGDSVLKKISNRLLSILPPSSLLSRFGGDEFVILLPHHLNVEEFIDELLGVIEKPIVMEGLTLHISASFGWVNYPEDAKDLETLIRFADTAMYFAKQQQGAVSKRYSKEIDHHNERLLLLENQLRKDIAHRKIDTHYQPLFCAQNNEMMGVECLARWHHNFYGAVSSAEFIPLAENTGLINKLGDIILEEAILSASQLYQFCENKNVYFSVNASPIQLTQRGFVDRVNALLTKYNLPPKLLKIEVTETLFIGGNVQAIATLNQLKSIGVSVALDDFGTGYSAMAVLKEGFIDILKVDKSFVKNIADNEQEKLLLNEIISLAHVMGLKVVAEGVETQAQRDILVLGECDVLQGFFLAKPMSKGDFCSYMGCLDSYIKTTQETIN